MGHTLNDELEGIAYRVCGSHPTPWSVELVPAKENIRGSKPKAVIRDANTKIIEPFGFLLGLGQWEEPKSSLGSATLINSAGDADTVRFVVAAVNRWAGKDVPFHVERGHVEELPPSPGHPEWGSDTSLERIAADWTRYAKETLLVEYIGHAYYAFGSELACMRLYAIYRAASKTRVAFSTNREQWFFSLELS